MLVSYSGALRVKEAHNLRITNVKFDVKRKKCEIDIVELKNCVERSFLITEEKSYNIIKMYHEMLPRDKLEDGTEPYFYPAYHKRADKFTRRTRRGVEWLQAFVKKVAADIGLPDSKRYTHHSFRRSSATAAYAN